MTSKRRVPPEAIPMIAALAGTASLFFSFAALTSNTGNILAWGFKGLPSLGKSGFPLFVYELVHASSAYGGFLAGLWLVGLTALIMCIRRFITANRARGTLWTIWVVGTASFIAFNAVLFFKPDSSHAPEYLMMLVSDPLAGEDYGISPFRFWFLALPALAALVFLIPILRRIPGSVQAVFQTMPLFAIPFVAANYFSYHYLCFGSPDVYTGLLNFSTPVLIIAPAALFTYLTLKTNKARRTRRG